MKLNKKKAFTLTELLVVVIVIGTLSAVVLPKFNKVMETRKTTEAEEIMAAVRTEEERRCALDKRYHTKIDQLSELVPDVDTKNFTYALTTTGMTATSKGKYNFTLEMPSYADGRIACVGGDCEKLNKVYPTKEELLAMADYQVAPAECEAKTCKGDSTRTCGWDNSGTQTRSCSADGEWSEWSTCAISGCNPDTKPQYQNKHVKCTGQHQQCNTSLKCNQETHEWYYASEADGVPLEEKCCHHTLSTYFDGWIGEYTGSPGSSYDDLLRAYCPSEAAMNACANRYGEICTSPVEPSGDESRAGDYVCFVSCHKSMWTMKGNRPWARLRGYGMYCTESVVQNVWYD